MMRKFARILLAVSLILAATNTLRSEQSYDAVIAMCRPKVSQIKNIEWLYEKNLISLRRIKLLCIYHQQELTDYQPAFEYVASNELSWVEFVPIKGMVKIENLFKQNRWTQDFLSIFKRSNGIIFTGGEDIPPAIYHDQCSLLTEPETPVRSLYEVSFLFHLLGGSRNPSWIPFLEQNKKYCVLGICLGAQTMNVAAGGNLYQDIPSEIYHKTTVEAVLSMHPEKIHSSRYKKYLNPLPKTMSPVFHTIDLMRNGLLVKELNFSAKDKPFVLSSHHQAIKQLGKNLQVIATSRDGKVIEAISHSKYGRVLGVQFHPEYHYLFLKSKFYRKNPEDEVNFNLREFLIKNPPSMKFHEKIWEWFSRSLR